MQSFQLISECENSSVVIKKVHFFLFCEKVLSSVRSTDLDKLITKLPSTSILDSDEV